MHLTGPTLEESAEQQYAAAQGNRRAGAGNRAAANRTARARLRATCECVVASYFYKVISIVCILSMLNYCNNPTWGRVVK